LKLKIIVIITTIIIALIIIVENLKSPHFITYIIYEMWVVL
jgi:hypothetical protein